MIRKDNMNIFELFTESISVLKTNKLRTSLSALGIIIGIGSVISLMNLGNASQLSIKERIQSLGSNLLIIRPGSSNQGFIRESSGSGSTLTYEDAKAIGNSNRITTIKDVGADYSSREQISYERNNANVQILAVTSNYFDIRNVQVEYGNKITDQDLTNLTKVAVIGPTIIEDLFGTNTNPIGQKMRIGNSTFTIIGVTKSKGGSNDEVVYIPLTTGQKTVFGIDYVNNIYVSAKSEDQMNAAQNQLGFFLMERHNIKNVEDADFSISSQEDLLQTATDVTQTFTALLTGISAISLVVGGIGIMNIMLVTVTERTREIGLRKALGAKKSTIVKQFLIESIVLTFVGGLIGVIVGLGVSFGLTKYMSLPQTISVSSITLAVGVSTCIGILFGWYPANKASKLPPIEALRYE